MFKKCLNKAYCGQHIEMMNILGEENSIYFYLIFAHCTHQIFIVDPLNKNKYVSIKIKFKVIFD